VLLQIAFVCLRPI